jgi:hypothetical protein
MEGGMSQHDALCGTYIESENCNLFSIEFCEVYLDLYSFTSRDPRATPFPATHCTSAGNHIAAKP